MTATGTVHTEAGIRSYFLLRLPIRRPWTTITTYHRLRIINRRGRHNTVFAIRKGRRINGFVTHLTIGITNKFINGRRVESAVGNSYRHRSLLFATKGLYQGVVRAFARPWLFRRHFHPIAAFHTALATRRDQGLSIFRHIGNEGWRG